jgi:hypothetical protein
MFSLEVIVAINNDPVAKARFNKGGLNATVHMGFGTKTYPADQVDTRKDTKKITKKIAKK